MEEFMEATKKRFETIDALIEAIQARLDTQTQVLTILQDTIKNHEERLENLE